MRERPLVRVREHVRQSLQCFNLTFLNSVFPNAFIKRQTNKQTNKQKEKNKANKQLANGYSPKSCF